MEGGETIVEWLEVVAGTTKLTNPVTHLKGQAFAFYRSCETPIKDPIPRTGRGTEEVVHACTHSSCVDQPVPQLEAEDRREYCRHLRPGTEVPVL